MASAQNDSSVIYEIFRNYPSEANKTSLKTFLTHLTIKCFNGAAKQNKVFFGHVTKASSPSSA